MPWEKFPPWGLQSQSSEVVLSTRASYKPSHPSTRSIWCWAVHTLHVLLWFCSKKVFHWFLYLSLKTASKRLPQNNYEYVIWVIKAAWESVPGPQTAHTSVGWAGDSWQKITKLHGVLLLIFFTSKWNLVSSLSPTASIYRILSRCLVNTCWKDWWMSGSFPLGGITDAKVAKGLPSTHWSCVGAGSSVFPFHEWASYSNWGHNLLQVELCSLKNYVEVLTLGTLEWDRIWV